MVSEAYFVDSVHSVQVEQGEGREAETLKAEMENAKSWNGRGKLLVIGYSQ